MCAIEPTRQTLPLFTPRVDLPDEGDCFRLRLDAFKLVDNCVVSVSLIKGGNTKTELKVKLLDQDKKACSSRQAMYRELEHVDQHRLWKVF